MKKILLFSITLMLITSCTQNQRARSFGGTEVINLPPGDKLVNITWKQDDMWLLTRKSIDSDTSVSYSFKEKSSFGMLEGEITINESIFN